MERKRNCCADKRCLDNLTPLLRNEFNRHQILNSEKDKQNRIRFGDKSVKSVKNLSVTKSVNENSLDLVINVELRKRKSNYMDAYFTDLDLKERKLFHETVSKREQLPNNSQLSELSVLFPDDTTTSSDSNPFSLSYDEDKERCKIIKSSNLHSAVRKENSNLTDDQNDRDIEKFFFEPRKKMLKNWSPVHYGDIMNMKMNGDYEEDEEEDDKEDNRFTKDTTTNHTNFKVMPLLLNKCNKKFFSINNLVSVTNQLNYITNRCKHDNEGSDLENEIMALSDPEVDFEHENLQYEQSEWRNICSTVQFSDRPCSIKMRTSSKFSAYENCNYEKCKTDANSQSNTFQRRYCKKNSFKFNRDDNLKHHIILKPSCDSDLTNNISSTEVTKDTVNHNKDINYTKRKYYREYKELHYKQIVENRELLDVFNTDNNMLLDFDLDIDLLKRSSNVSVSIECTASVKNDDIEIDSQNNNKGLSEKQNTDNVTATKKIVEVIFPVKSLRVSGDNINNNEVLKEDSSLPNVSLVKSDDCNLAKYEQLQDLRIRQSSLLNREVEYDDNNSVSHKHFNLRTVLNSEEFRTIVMNIIEQYLKDNYLRDDNFEVIVVPKDRNTCKKNMIDALKGIINKNSSDIDLKSESNYGIAFPDLSMFNPRDYKGHTRKHGRTNQIVVAPETLRKQSNKSSKHYTSLTVTHLPLGEIGLLDPNTKEARKNLTKYLSMPVMKFKSFENIMDTPNSNVEHSFYVEQLNCYNTEVILDVIDNESDAIQQYLPQFNQENVLFHSIDYIKPNKKLMKMKKRHKKFDKRDFFAKFNEFKEVFDKVENKHNTLLDTLNYDPCGLLFKSKSGQFVVIKRS